MRKMRLFWVWSKWRWGFFRLAETGKINALGERINYKGFTHIYIGPLHIKKWG